MSKKARIMQNDKVKIKVVKHPVEAFSQISVDLVGPIIPTSSRGHKYVMCVVCNFSKWPELIPLRTLTAKEACDALIGVFTRVGLPLIIQNDNATNLISGLNEEVYRRLGIEMRRVTPLHPEGNAGVERWNSTFKKMLHHLVNTKFPKEWDKRLPFVLWAYRETINRTNNISPYQLVYGKLPRGPLGILKNTWDKVTEGGGKLKEGDLKYVENLKENLKLAAEMAEEHSLLVQQGYVDRYNKHAKDKLFKEGDSVLILLPTSSNRLVSTWQGPGIVTSKISENSYRINIDGGSKTVHANRLRLYKCQIATVGVIFDEEEQFGEIEYYPELEKDRDNEKRIKELDLSHLGVNKADQLRKVLLKHTKVFDDKPGCCNILSTR